MLPIKFRAARREIIQGALLFVKLVETIRLRRRNVEAPDPFSFGFLNRARGVDRKKDETLATRPIRPSARLS